LPFIGDSLDFSHGPKPDEILSRCGRQQHPPHLVGKGFRVNGPEIGVSGGIRIAFKAVGILPPSARAMRGEGAPATGVTGEI